MNTTPARLATWIALADAALYLRGYANGALDAIEVLGSWPSSEPELRALQQAR